MRKIQAPQLMRRLTFALALLSVLQSAPIFAQEIATESRLGISVAGQLPTVAGAFAPILLPQTGFFASFDIPAPLIDGPSRLFISGGLQSFTVAETPLLSLSTYEILAGIGLRSKPYFWILFPTLNIGLGATVGNLQIEGTTGEIPNMMTYFTTLVSPGVSARLFAGFSMGIEMPVRVLFSRAAVTTLSPALSLRYDL